MNCVVPVATSVDKTQTGVNQLPYIGCCDGHRHSPRNNYVPQVLRRGGMGTLLMDLLTPSEDAHHATRFDIELLTQTVLTTTRWLQSELSGRLWPLGNFGASTGAAAALQAAARSGQSIAAVVSRGGGPISPASMTCARYGAPPCCWWVVTIRQWSKSIALPTPNLRSPDAPG
jgi:pimeloyl-ACP methyl ester carboxylesterase